MESEMQMMQAAQAQQMEEQAAEQQSVV